MGKANLDTKDAIQSVKDLIIQVEKLNSSIGKIGSTNSKSFTELKTSMDGLKTAVGGIKQHFTELKDEIKRNSTILKTNSRRLTKNSKLTGRLGDLIKTNSKNLRQNTTQVKKNTTEQNKNNASVEKGTKARGKSNKSLTKSVALGNLWAKGIQKIMELGRKAIVSIVKLTVKFESLGFAIEKISGDAFETGRSWIFLMELNNSFGASLVDTTERWLKFRAAAKQSGLALKETKDIFRSMTKASAVLGLSTDELRGVYLALEQMLSKGKVTTEELRRQLGERLPGAMGIMAGSMGVTIAELDKMMKRGEILSAEVLPNFAKAMEGAYGIESVKKVETLNAGIGRLTGTWEQFVLTITEGDSTIRGVFDFFLNAGTVLINNFIKALEDADQRLRRLQSQNTGEVSDKISGDAASSLALSGSQLQTAKEINIERAKTLKLMSELSRAGKGNTDEYRKLEEQVTSLTKKAIDYNDALTNQKVIDAPARIEELKKEFAELGTSYEHLKNLVESDFVEPNVQLGLYPSQEEIDIATGSVTKSLEEIGANFKRIKEDGSGTFLDKIEVDEDIAFMVEEYEQLIELLEKPLKSSPVDPDAGKKGRKVRFAKEFQDDNKNLILEAQKRQVILKNSIDKEQRLLSLRIGFQEEIQREQAGIIDMQEEDELNSFKLRLKNEKDSWDNTLKTFDKKSKNYAEQKEQHEKALTQITERWQKEEEDILAKFALKRESNDLQEYQDRVDLLSEFYARRGEIIQNDFDTGQGQRTAQRNITATGTSSATTLDYADERAAHELKQALLRNELELQKKLLIGAEALSFAQIEAIEAVIAALEGQLLVFKTQEELLFTGEDAWQNWAKKAVEVQQEVASAINAIFDRRIELIQRQIDKETEMFDKSLEMAKNDEAEKKIIERNKEKRLAELEKKKKKEQIKQAKFQKANALSQAIISGTLAIINAFTTQPVWLGIAMGAIMSTIVTAQIATIAAEPIPKFAKGGRMTHDGVAQINDGGALEYVERGDEVFTAQGTNALVNLKKDDIVHKDFEAFRKTNHSFFLDNGILGFGKSNIDEEIIVGAIEKGFNKAKINTKVTVLNKMEDNSYKEQMSNWN